MPPTIARSNGLTTAIIIFAVEPSRQADLLANIERFLMATVQYQAGFVSATLHKSLDGARVVNYAQWRTEADYDAFLRNSEVQAATGWLSLFAPPDSRLYAVAASEPESPATVLAPNTGALADVAVFKTTPDTQEQAVALAREAIDLLRLRPGFVSTHIHRSFDGTRVIGYSQWRSESDFRSVTGDLPAPIRKLFAVAEYEAQPALFDIALTWPN
ncbi:antibiotic biosynthesis monooxygenase family protein [Gloeobacter morelensis]|uniref:Antibiotic biosynthesis monooxygenase n=1 Tax=Gloeobacter morelensis MG652769 TaxID=2781736 RepID=A0ABY3PK21_9CYAN|nr:antibiotic biosynthesis monooxygenase family protein [Gloeobacter morelensis]UFP94020.1 antibiotic biosynthesis monooxygenase [Gloeobacter morelensis MG652769]